MTFIYAVISISIGERITELRTQQNISQVQLAKMLDISRQAVSKWENDQTAPDTIKLIQLADLLDTDVEYLATGRKTYGRRPPVVIETTQTIEKIVEKPVIQTVERIVEKPVIQIVEKPVVEIKKVYRTKYIRNIWELCAVGIVTFIIGLLVGLIF